MSKRLPKIIIVCGPTATGKSDLAVELARAYGGEVISADSRQVYRGLDLGSGKITAREMKGVPHHLLDIADPKKDRYTVEDFVKDGTKAISDIVSRGNLPIVCGGTGFYIDALVSGESFPAVPPNKRLRQELAKKSPEALMALIRKLDPRRAKELDPFNKVRIIRAIEIAKALGRVPRTKKKDRYEILWIGISADRDTLRERIHVRLLKRMRAGMLRETRELRDGGVSWKRLHEFGLEYRYVSLIAKGSLPRKEALERLEWEILHFSKRQMTWFKRNARIRWIKPGESSKALAFAKAFLETK